MKRFFSLVLALLLCLSLFACGKQPVQTPPADEPPASDVSVCPPAQDPVTPPEEPVPADPRPGEQVAPELPEVVLGSATTIFKDDSENPVLQMDVTLPACEDFPQIDGYYKAIYDDLYAICALNAQEAAQRRAEFVTDGLDFHPWAVAVKGSVTRNDGVTLSVVREVYEQLGGPYPTVSYLAETFDVASQGRLLLADLFLPDADYANRLPVTEPDQLNFALTDGFLLLCTEDGTVSVLLSDLSDILLPQYVTE